MVWVYGSKKGISPNKNTHSKNEIPISTDVSSTNQLTDEMEGLWKLEITLKQQGHHVTKSRPRSFHIESVTVSSTPHKTCSPNELFSQVSGRSRRHRTKKDTKNETFTITLKSPMTPGRVVEDSQNKKAESVEFSDDLDDMPYWSSSDDDVEEIPETNSRGRQCRSSLSSQHSPELDVGNTETPKNSNKPSIRSSPIDLKSSGVLSPTGRSQHSPSKLRNSKTLSLSRKTSPHSSDKTNQELLCRRKTSNADGPTLLTCTSPVVRNRPNQTTSANTLEQNPKTRLLKERGRKNKERESFLLSSARYSQRSCLCSLRHRHLESANSFCEKRKQGKNKCKPTRDNEELNNYNYTENNGSETRLKSRPQSSKSHEKITGIGSEECKKNAWLSTHSDAEIASLNAKNINREPLKRSAESSRKQNKISVTKTNVSFNSSKNRMRHPKHSSGEMNFCHPEGRSFYDFLYNPNYTRTLQPNVTKGTKYGAPRLSVPRTKSCDLLPRSTEHTTRAKCPKDIKGSNSTFITQPWKA
ncbi:uncharacterized protein LOC134844589 [Symsagittifera roscoffensis]|uniref:uncharacterized protein LOC134844589 n=1 Tax=Symsagittifera roscoffensis TaxID=84072 RepID=UPI00307B7115